MVKNYLNIILVCLLLCFVPDNLESNCITEIAETQLGVREATGNNDGFEVEMYQKSAGSKRGQPWCASYVHWVLKTCSIKNKVNPSSGSAFNRNNIVYYKGKFLKSPREGDVFCLYSIAKGRIAHTGFYIAKKNEKFYITNEGNTNEGGVFDGDGVYEKIRSFNTTYCISRWE